jgi:arginine/ornithine transport system substrate-binding protein
MEVTMKRLFGLTALALACLVAGTADAKEWTKVRLATEGAYAPFNLVDTSGELAGFDIDIGNALCAEMKVECTWVKQDWDGMIPALVARKYDAIVAQMSITPERQQKISFSGKYSNTPSGFIAKDGTITDIAPASLKGKKIGVQRETIQDKYATENYPDSEIVRYGTADEVNLDIVAGRIDVLLVDKVVGADAFLKTEQGKGFAFVGPDIPLGGGAGIGVRKEDTALAEMFTKAIAAIRANGTYETIAKKYFDFDVYGATS